MKNNASDSFPGSSHKLKKEMHEHPAGGVDLWMEFVHFLVCENTKI
jgi:hypothetical protein